MHVYLLADVRDKVQTSGAGRRGKAPSFPDISDLGTVMGEVRRDIER